MQNNQLTKCFGEFDYVNHDQRLIAEAIEKDIRSMKDGEIQNIFHIDNRISFEAHVHSPEDKKTIITIVFSTNKKDEETKHNVGTLLLMQQCAQRSKQNILFVYTLKRTRQVLSEELNIRFKLKNAGVNYIDWEFKHEGLYCCVSVVEQ